DVCSSDLGGVLLGGYVRVRAVVGLLRRRAVPRILVVTTGHQIQTDVAHASALPLGTSSPGGEPEARSVSSAFCRITTAAAWSTTALRFFPFLPPARSSDSAVTVLNRSSDSLTGTGASTSANSVAKARTRTAAGPSAPDSDRGRPTTTSIGSCSSARVRSCWRSPGPRCTVVSGVAMMPDGSQAATPIRTSPGSTPRRTPGRIALGAPAADGGADGVERIADPRDVAAAALGDVVLAAALAAEGGCRGPQQLVGREPPLAGGRIGRHHDRGLAAAIADDGDDGGGTLAEPAAHVERELADVAAAGAGRMVTHEPDAPEVLGPGGEVTGRGEELFGPQPLQLLLHRLEPIDGLPDPVDEV